MTSEDDGRGRRTRAQLVRDLLAVPLTFLLGLVLLGTTLDTPAQPSDAFLVTDLVSGALLCGALWWRRRFPVALAVAGAVVGSYSDVGGAAGLVLLFTVAVHRRWQVVAPVAVLHVLGAVVYIRLRPDPTTPALVWMALVAVLVLAVVAWGMFVRARRQLVESLRERAERAEAEQSARVEQAREAERTRIAREMHDVLAHRLSLLSMHAGALEFRPDASPADVAAAAGVIREAAHHALDDLREVIGVLRSAPDDAAGRPQPVLGDLPALVEECRSAGARVETDVRLDLAAVPAVSGRNAYRIVQEGLTNARKHAPGSVVHVLLDGGPGSGLRVRLTNPPSVGAPSGVPGGGTGLVGLAERASLAGGRLEHRRDADGAFRLEAHLPWPA